MKKIYPIFLVFACLFSLRSIAQCTNPTTVPYMESFENMTANNQLPACWAISDPTTCLTYTAGAAWNGTGDASFYYSPAQSSYFYSKAVQLYSGITYSASAWYKVSSNNTITWTDFSILLGTSQSSTGLVSIASTNGPAVNIIYSPVSNTFVVTSSGVYYLAVRGISNGSSSGSMDLTWDGLSVIIPCTTTFNPITVTIAASATSVCNGQGNFTATAAGANTYTWSDGTTSPTNTNAPQQNLTYSVVGTNTLTGCTNSATLNIPIKTAPFVLIVPSTSQLCSGKTVLLSASGAATYSWSTGSTASTTSVAPTVSTNYSVVGTGTNGCSTNADYTVTVLPLPVVTVAPASITICQGESTSFVAGGAIDFTWLPTGSNSPSFQAHPASSTSFTVIGTAASGCSNSAVMSVIVDACTGLLTSKSSNSNTLIFPNPTSGIITIDFGTEGDKEICVENSLGALIFESKINAGKEKIDLSSYTKGIYFVKIKSQQQTQSFKIVLE